MLHYIIQTVAFQLFFLIVYDAFLKRETFFNWNRAYLLVTAVLSVTLPFIKIQSFKNVLPNEYIVAIPEVIIGNFSQPESLILNSNSELVDISTFQFGWEHVFYLGVFAALVIFMVKLFKIVYLINKNPKHWSNNLRIVLLQKSKTAFSFFYYVFLGEEIKAADKSSIIKHESVHVKQKHTLDLLLFEVLRIIFWFNPLVYLYQNRIASLHEFIADAEAVKMQTKKEYYQDLLSQFFEAEQTSFINTFYKKSLIKKRIIMLNKAKSKQIHLTKYMLLLPLVLAMLTYTSSFAQELSELENSQVQIENSEISNQESLDMSKLKNSQNQKVNVIEAKENSQIRNTSTQVSDPVEVPFGVIDQIPMFPNCKSLNSTVEQKKCMTNTISNFIQTNFNVKVADNLNLSGKQRIVTAFKIDKEGKVFDARARAQHNALVDEAVRVINMLPKFIPGEHKGKKVIVPYSVPIIFEVKGGDEIPFAKVDKAPTIDSCQNLGTNEEQKKCTSNYVSKHVQQNFNTDLPSKLGLVGKQRIMITFVINKEGEMEKLKARAPHEDLKKEAIKAVKSLPKFIPGEHKGKKVSVSYSLPIVFMVNK